MEQQQHWVLIDEQSGLHVPWYFWLRVLDEVNRSTRYGAPFGLLLLEGKAKAGDRSLRAVPSAISLIPAAIRGTDLAGLLGPGKVGVLLTHQDDVSAQQARDRILERMEAGGATKHVDWAPRLLTFPEHAAEISFLLTGTWQAEHGFELRQSA